MPVSIFTVVDLPAPLGPRSPTSCPVGISRSRPRTASTSPKRLESWRRRITRRRPRGCAAWHRRPARGSPASAPSVVLGPLRAHEAIFGIGEQNVECGEAAVGARDVVLELEAVLVGELGVRVDALLEHAQALAHGDDLAEEGLDRDGLLLRAGLARLHDELAAGPALADLTRHRLLGVQHGAYRLHDLADVLVVERHGVPQPAISAAARASPGAARSPGRPCCRAGGGSRTSAGA